jgi:hypothetical protein
MSKPTCPGHLGQHDKNRIISICVISPKVAKVLYFIKSSIVCPFYIKNDAEIFPAHHTWKVAEKGFKISFMMNKLAVINSFGIILEK